MVRKRYLNSISKEWCDKYSTRMEYINDIYSGYISLINIEKVNNRLVLSIENRELCLGDDGYTWLTFLPDNSHWCMTAIYDDTGNIIEWYFDITKANCIDNQGNPYQDDLYLDVVLLPNGNINKLDEDELQEALNNGEITKQEFSMAHDVCDKLIDEFISVEDAVESFCKRCFLMLNESLSCIPNKHNIH